ncbi:histidine triad nucleotide-binding protein 3-like [Chanos chanos]|uniref:Histidine triad nucleotide-binding protein 3-like n=1 Tax=Chanos chanos TaxID=29144 RepID=A0A6J2V652_CHACN|nr:histidine triad nucleotide-binding protein 3-like [Chanos chanos]
MATSESTQLGNQGDDSLRADDTKCVFCVIANCKTENEILCRDGELACFRDAKPGARHHYLVVPRAHVGNCKSLNREHVPLVERMVKMGRSVLQQKNVMELGDVRMGFHMPPFSSVPHLHLHVLAPASEMSDRSLRFYGPQSYWFITVENLLKQLKSQNEVK